MVVKVLMVSSGYKEETGMTYPIRLALAMRTLKGVKIGLLCQEIEDDYDNIEIFTYSRIIDRYSIDKKELDHLLENVGKNWDVIIAGSDSVVEIANNIAIALAKPIFGFFMGFPLQRMYYPQFQRHYTQKTDYFERYIHRTFVPSNFTQNRIRKLGFKGGIGIIPLGVEDYDDIPPMEIDMEGYEKLIVTINRDADHKCMEDFFIMANLHPEYKFVWITYQPSTYHLRQMQPDNLLIQRANNMGKIGLLKRADAFVFTSWDEGYLLSCMEALACQTRVVVKASKLAYELLWKYSAAKMVAFYDFPSWLNLEELLAPEVEAWLPVPHTIQTALTVFSYAFNDIKAQHINDVFRKKTLPGSQQVASLYDTLAFYDKALIQMKGSDDPYHADNWKYLYVSHYIKGEDIIDLGCGMGHTVKRLLDDNYNVIAYDISKKITQDLEKEYSSDIIAGTLCVEQFDACNPTPDTPQKDTVICQELLEHVQDPSIVVKTALDLAKKVAIFTTPIEHAADDPAHLQHFKKEDIEVIFAEFGKEFSVTEIGRPDKPNVAPSHFMIVVEIKKKC